MTTFSIDINQGDDFSMGLLFSDESGPIDITGWVIRCKLKVGVGALTSVAELTPTIAADQTANKGKATLSMAGSVSGAIPIKETVKGLGRAATTFVSDIVAVDSNGKEKTWGTGVFNILPVVSRA